MRRQTQEIITSHPPHDRDMFMCVHMDYPYLDSVNWSMETGAKKIRLFRTLKIAEILTEIPYATLDSTSQQCPCGAADDEGLRNRQKSSDVIELSIVALLLSAIKGKPLRGRLITMPQARDLGTGVLFEL